MCGVCDTAMPTISRDGFDEFLDVVCVCEVFVCVCVTARDEYDEMLEKKHVY